MPRPFKRKRTKHEEVRDERREARGDEARQNSKRRRVEQQDARPDHIQDEVALEDDNFEQPNNEGSEFYGLLTDEESAYYANINNKIVANDFESEEERQNLIEAVYRESTGKELKLASSQSCSRHLERLIHVSTPEQLAGLFEKLLDGLTHLAQHRFGSHVLETLFAESAKYVQAQKSKKKERDDTSTILENCFQQTAKGLEPNFGFLVTDRFGSHVIRTLVLVLAGEPLESTETKKVLASKKKEKLDQASSDKPMIETRRAVPESFRATLSELITTAVSRIDGTYLRALATHPVGNPVLQILLKIEFSNSDKGRSLGEDSLFNKLFSLESLDDDSEGAKLVTGLMYDSTGSHLVEIVVQNAPGKVFKKLFKSVWSSRLATMAKNDIASYVAIKIMERLGKDDLANARDVLVQQLPALIERRRFQLLQTLVDRCVVRGTDLRPLAEAMKVNFKADRSQLLRTVAGVEETSMDDTDKMSVRADGHGCSLAQSLLQAPLVSSLTQESLLAIDTAVLVGMAKDSSASRLLQTALASTESDTAFRKRLIPKFYQDIEELAASPSGSYFVEALWEGTKDVHFMKERIAEELAKHESALRDSMYGRNVWRTWMMDMYTRRHGEWQANAKGRQGNAATPQAGPKSAIQMARERHGQTRPKQSANGVRQDVGQKFKSIV